MLIAAQRLRSIFAPQTPGDAARRGKAKNRRRRPSPLKAPLKHGLYLALPIAVIVGVGLGALQANVNRLTIEIPGPALALGGAGVIGLLMGLATRVALKGRASALKLLVSLLGLLLGIIVAESTYALLTRLNPFYYVPYADNWIEAGQLTIGCLSAIAVGRMGRSPVPTRAPGGRRLRPRTEENGNSPVGASLPQRNEPGPRVISPSPASPRPAWQPAGGRRERAGGRGTRAGVPLPWLWQRRLLALPKLRLPGRPGPSSRNLHLARGSPVPAPPRPAWRSRGGQVQAAVRVIAKTEDICPYCLDVVTKNDPRGVVVCEICKTPHHADCWALTGTCQVPHLNT
jgi:hypothetical protein